MNRASLTPAAAVVPTSISPTPQKDGRVLGLFDLLGRTPSGSSVASLTADAYPVAATPSKRRANDAFPQTTETIPPAAMTPTSARFATTPQSGAPLHSRRDNGNAPPFKTPTANRTSEKKAIGDATPSSATPSFLRRRNVSAAVAGRTSLARVDENDEGAANDGNRTDDEEEAAWKRVGPLRLPRKLGFGRSLSSVVASLRKMEDEAYADDEEALREMEMASSSSGRNQPGTANNTTQEGGAVTKDSQGAAVELGRDPSGKANAQGTTTEPAVGLLSGFDDEGLYDSPDEEEQKGAQQQPLRQFKKRGQKRTTRLVKIRPTRTKRPAQADVEDESDEAEADGMVPETQLKPSSKSAAAAGDDDDLPEADSASDAGFDPAAADDDDDDDDDDNDDEKQGDKSKTKNSRSSTATNNKDGKTNSTGEGVVKRAVRKVKATAHANFKRLKLRNSGAKGGPAHNSRFRRRR
ncbi:hypothetical protein VTH82DRAFT_6467 [Thermothelomyces myriococcoides]